MSAMRAIVAIILILLAYAVFKLTFALTGSPETAAGVAIAATFGLGLIVRKLLR